MNEERMLKPALIGGVLLGIVSSLPVIGWLNCACCAWVVAGGFLAAYLYVKDSSAPVTLGRGTALGLATGAIGGAIYILFSIPLFLMTVGGSKAGALEQIRQRVEQLPNLPPETRDAFRNLSLQSNTLMLIVALCAIVILAIYCLFAMMGSAIGVAVFEKRPRGAAAAESSPYSPPPDLPPPPPPPADAP